MGFEVGQRSDLNCPHDCACLAAITRSVAGAPHDATTAFKNAGSVALRAAGAKVTLP